MLPTVAIVGAGRVGRALGRRLSELGWRIGAVVCRSDAKGRAAVRAIGDGQPHSALTRQVVAADVILIATPDAAVRTVAGKVILHTSGALDRTALAPLERRGAATGSLHPLQTFSGRGVPELEGAFMAIEGAPGALQWARRIARSLGGIPVRIDGRSKPAYHAAGVLVAGHGLALVEAATRMLMTLGFTRRHAARALLPLMRQMLDNFERLGPGSAWTGPLSRGDYSTIAAHASALRRLPREYRRAYVALSWLGVALLSRHPEAVRPCLARALARG